MNLSKSKITILIGVLLVLFFALSLLFRVALPYDSIFTGGWVKFASNDAYFHMRYVDNLVHNFPHVTKFDPFYIYPAGGTSGGVYFFDWLLAIIIWIIGLGSPTQHLIDVVAAYYPAVLAALTVIPVFFIGKALFNRWVGVLAAFLVAILPGEFMGRSILGFTDNHVAETLFSTVVAMFLILAIKAAGAKQDGQGLMTFNHLIKRDRKVITMPLVYSLLAGIFLGIYLITWMGALLFVFIFGVYLLIQTIVNHSRQKSSDHLGIIGFIVFLVAMVIILPTLLRDWNVYFPVYLAMVAALFIPPVLAVASRLFSRWKLSTIYYPLSLIGLGVIVILILHAVTPGAVSALWTDFVSVFAPGGGSTAATTMEMQPFLSPQGAFTTAVAWGNFTTDFFLISPNAPRWLQLVFPGFAFIPIGIFIWLHNKKKLTLLWGFVLAVVAIIFWLLPFNIKQVFVGFGLISFLILLWLHIKQRSENENLSFFLIWTLLMLIATLVQRRFAYYLVVNIAVLSAYISWQIIWLAGLRRLTLEPGKNPGEARLETAGAKPKKKPEMKQSLLQYRIVTVLAIIVVVFLVCFWNITESKATASTAPYAPSDGWEESLNWMKDNTPDPMGDPDAYYKLYNLDFKYPATAYGVTAWWDYGYWISRIAHRFPSANPSQDPTAITKVANLFLSQDEASANKMMADLDSSYIIADYDITSVYDIDTFYNGKYWAVINWAKQDPSKYVANYYVQYQGYLVPKCFYYPGYYNSTIVRTYNLDGKEATSGTPLVITYDDKVQNGNHYRVVSHAEKFSSYKAAQDFVKNQKTGNYDIVGSSPFVSAVPLEALKDTKLVYSSQPLRSHRDLDWNSETQTWDITVTKVPEIKIFEHAR